MTTKVDNLICSHFWCIDGWLFRVFDEDYPRFPGYGPRVPGPLSFRFPGNMFVNRSNV